MSDTRLLVIAVVFVVVIMLAGTVFRNSIVQLLDTIAQGVRLVD